MTSGSPAPAEPASRTGRIARALTLGYTFQAVVAVTGLVLTPFLLRELGVADYGLWLVVGQVLGLLGLLDLGVTAVLPREVARASGSAGVEPVAEVVRRAWWLVLLQTPVVGLAAAGVWFGVAAARPDLGGPLALILGVFVVQFPLRVPAAVLNGLQDLTFCAAAQAASWLVTTVLSVSLVFAGWGLYALAAGWAAGQLLACAACGWRLRRKFPLARPTGGWPGLQCVRGHLRSGLWVSASQLSQLLVMSTDLLILAWVIGPHAAVVYSCTTKLLGLMSNQCYSIGLTAQPALAQLRAAGETERLLRAIPATGLVLLSASGLVAIVVASANEAFVTWWVGPALYAGPLVTLLAVLAMLLRHLAFGWWNAAYVLGYERRIAVVLIADGVITLTATAAWVAAVGMSGAPLGSLTGVVLVYAPTGLFTAAAATGVSPLRVLAWVWPLAVGFAVVFAPAVAVLFSPSGNSPWFAGSAVAVGIIVYATLLYRLAEREPLRPYRDQFVAAIRRQLGRSPPGAGLS